VDTIFNSWWNKRKASNHAWKVSVKSSVDRNCNHDSKKSHQVEMNHGDPEKLMQALGGRGEA